MVRTLLAGLIRWYQRRLSPLKGFACAYRVRTGGPSCSTVIREGVLREGPWRAASLARAQFARCREAYLSLQMSDFRPPAQGTVAAKKRRRAEPAPYRRKKSRCDGWDLCECAPFPLDFPCDDVAGIACDTGLAEVACCASP